MNRRQSIYAGVLAGTLVLAGCAEEPTKKATGSTSPSTTSSSSSSPAPSSEAAQTSDAAAASSSADASASPSGAEAPFVADTNPDTATATPDAALVLTSVRSAAQQGYDRVVLEFTGPGTPGWQAQYADVAARQGTGEPISAGGGAILDIAVSGSAIPKEGQATVPAGPITPQGTSAVVGVYVDGTFEGTTHVVLGIDSKRAFRVFTVANPPRVVIDVQK